MRTVKMMTLNEKREIAIGSVRSIARGYGWEPSSLSADKALSVLDDLMRTEPNSVASVWYVNATEHQISLFKQEWRRWCSAAQTAAFSTLQEKGAKLFGTDWLVMNLVVKEAAENYGMDARKDRLVLTGIAYRCCMAFADTRKNGARRMSFQDIVEGELFCLIPGIGQTYQKIIPKDTTELSVLHYGGADGRIVNAIPFPFTASKWEHTDCLFIPANRTVFVEFGEFGGLDH